MTHHACLLLPACVCAVLLSSCAGTTTWLNDNELRTTLEESRTPSGRHADAGAVILLDEGSMEINSGGEIGLSIFERHRIARILSPRGQRYANIMIPYGSTSFVDQIQARTILPDGRIIPLKEADIFDVSLYPNFVFFSDQRARIFTMPAIEDGAVIEYRYRLTISGRTFWHAWTFQDEVPVVLSRFTLVKPGEWDLVYRSYGTPIEPAVTKAPAGFRSKHVWEASHMPALQNEFGMPPPAEIATRIAFAPAGFKTWEDIAHWYAEIVGKRNTGGTAVGTMTDSLTRGARSRTEKLQRIFEWVRDHVRYIAVEIGTGGYEPHPADEVFAKRYGDCKDLVMLLSAMAHSANIEVRPALISTWHNGKPDTTLPSALQFNHLIGYAPDSTAGGLWLDPTDKAGTFGTLPWYDQGVPVVVAGSGDRGFRAITPKQPAAANSTALDWNVELNADGSALVSGTTVFTGAHAVDLGNELRLADSAEIRQWLGTSLAHRCPGAALLSYALPSVRPPQDTLAVTYRFRAPAFSARRDSHLIIRPWGFNAATMADYFRDEKRAYPVRFRHASRTDLRMTLWPPLGWQHEAASSADSLLAPCGQSLWRVRSQSDEARLGMTLEMQGEDVKPEQYTAFREFLDGVRLREWKEISLSRTR